MHNNPANASFTTLNAPPILLAEDFLDDVILFQQQFKKAQILNPIQVVSDGTYAINHLQAIETEEGNPLILFLDLRMPRTSGFDVLEWLHQNERFRSLPVIVLSGLGEVHDMARAYRYGIERFMVKPLALKDVIRSIERIESVETVNTKDGILLRRRAIIPVEPVGMN